ncbi:nucleotide modification associated domain-containing protein [Brachyspira hampsonii]|uniref:nucleotide modification associated domain-containing protein n=1 Tax=Brachyspira hampsonii TaxID=1287055 RepID=UPI000D39522D|nr:nucleotide modification associated domain-containing protein [Brachyspira hampsonii]PTY39452.1 hypothetical protein DQ06_02125 [Brachyspira hampsonii bv. II]
MNKEDLIINECEELKNLLIKKNKDYGNSYDKTLDEFGKQIGLVRIEDKLNRLKTLILSKEEPMVEESIIDTVFDIAGYAVLFSIYLKEKEENNSEKR